MRRACGDQEWAEAVFIFDRGVVYGLERNGQFVAAGNLTPFRGHFADVGSSLILTIEVKDSRNGWRRE